MEKRHKKIDVGIITALPEIELVAILKTFDINPSKKEDELIQNNRYWFSSIQTSKNNKELTIAITSTGVSGNINSNEATNDLIRNYKPGFLIFVGIAAGLQGKVELSDVVVSEKIIGYETGRLTPDGLEIRPQTEHPPQHILQDVRFFKQQVDLDIWIDLYNKLQKTLSQEQQPPENSLSIPNMHLGSIASGEKLFADGSIKEIRKRYDEKIRCGEMEGIGFAVACENNNVPWIVVRGISDFGNPLTKDGRLKDRLHFSAANSASSWLKIFLLKSYTGQIQEDNEEVSSKDINLCNVLIEKVQSLIAMHGLDDDIWAKAISSQYFLVGLANLLNMKGQKDYFNLLDRFLSSFHYNIKGELILEKNHVLITPEETERLTHFMYEEDKTDDFYSLSEKMKAQNIDTQQMHNNYHYGLTLRISSSEKIQVLDAIKKYSLDKLLKSDDSLDEYGGWYPYRIPFITARILISLKETDLSGIEDSEVNIIIERALESLIRRIYQNHYWRSGVGLWISKWESTALCLEALERWNYIKNDNAQILNVIKYILENQLEWMVDPPNFLDEESSNSTLSSVILSSIILRCIKNHYKFEDFKINPIDYLSYLERCLNAVSKIVTPKIRQFCTIPQVIFYITDTTINYMM